MLEKLGVGCICGICLIIFGACENEPIPSKMGSFLPNAKISGVNYSQTHILTENSLDLSPISAQWAALIPQYFGRQGQPIITSPFRWERLLPEAIEQARRSGLSLMIKPHVDFNESQVFRGDFTLDSEEEWQNFEARYQEIILSLADMAESYGVEMFCVGTELRLFVLKRPEYWRELITLVRDRYSGELVYAANWDEYHEIPFWEELDYIGVNAYFPLARTPIPGEEELRLGWTWYVDALEAQANKSCKRILFTEYGYRSAEQATWKHWELGVGTPSDSVQKVGYQAFFESFWEKPWVAGGLIWEWIPDPPRFNNTRWTPQGKAAEEVIREWYGR
ncbi:MAG: hypothetical protein AAF694_12065 [Bacteroidota bacterium]